MTLSSQYLSDWSSLEMKVSKHRFRAPLLAAVSAAVLACASSPTHAEQQVINFQINGHLQPAGEILPWNHLLSCRILLFFNIVISAFFEGF